jgi:hypothetical protein
MQKQTQLERNRLIEQKVQKVKELYADAQSNPGSNGQSSSIIETRSDQMLPY